MRGSHLAVLIALLGPGAVTAQDRVWLTDVEGHVSVLYMEGVFGAEVGDRFVWNRVVLNTSDSAKAPSFPSCDVGFEAPIVASPDTSDVEIQQEWLWPLLLYSWEIGTDSLAAIPAVSDLIEITRIESIDAQIQAARGHPETLPMLADRYSTLRFELYLPAHGSGALRACHQHAPTPSSRCIYREMREFESPWMKAIDIADALEDILARVRDGLMAR